MCGAGGGVGQRVGLTWGGGGGEGAGQALGFVLPFVQTRADRPALRYLSFCPAQSEHVEGCAAEVLYHFCLDLGSYSSSVP